MLQSTLLSKRACRAAQAHAEVDVGGEHGRGRHQQQEQLGGHDATPSTNQPTNSATSQPTSTMSYNDNAIDKT